MSGDHANADLDAAEEYEERFKVEQLLDRLRNIATGLRFNGQGEHADDVEEAVDLIAEAMEQEEDEDEDSDV